MLQYTYFVCHFSIHSFIVFTFPLFLNICIQISTYNSEFRDRNSNTTVLKQKLLYAKATLNSTQNNAILSICVRNIHICNIIEKSTFPILSPTNCVLMQAPNSKLNANYERHAQHHVLPTCDRERAPSSCEPTPRSPPAGGSLVGS